MIFPISKPICLILTTILLTCFFCSAHAETRPANEVTEIDRIIAVVDQTVITESELRDRIKVVSSQLEKHGTQLPPEKVLEKQILERLISDHLQLQFAAQTGLRVDDTQLDKTIDRIAEQNKMGVDDFQGAGTGWRQFPQIP